MKDDKDNTLLVKAMAHVKVRKHKNKFTEQDFELVEAWLDDKITLGQVGAAIKKSTNSGMPYAYIAQVCRAMKGKK